MPIYEYQCQACGHEFETMQKMSEDPLVDCELCGEPELRKLISAVAFRLKGSGWYETDFKSDNQRKIHEDASSESKSESEGAPKSASDTASDKSPASGTSETKPKAEPSKRKSTATADTKMN